VSTPRFAAVILDVDSTVSALEGIDWLATRRSAAVAVDVARLTDRAMAGEIALDDVYGLRLELVRPSRSDVAELADAYIAALVPGAESAVAALGAAGVQVALVSGGIRNAILPLAALLGIDSSLVSAVDVLFDSDGAYADYDRRSPLATQEGKPIIAASLGLPAPVLAVGDGATDAAMRSVVQAFAAFTGVVHRPAVVAAADLELHSFDDLLKVVLHDDPA
jgi:phosphoserine phosphatase